MCEQIIPGGVYDLLNPSATEYASVTGHDPRTWVAGSSNRDKMVCLDGIFKRFFVKLSAAPGSGTAYTFAFQNLTQATEISLTISDTDTQNSNIIDEIDCEPYDHVVIECAPTRGTPTAVYATWCISFLPDSANKFMLIGGHPNALNPAANEENFLDGSDTWMA